MSDKLVKIGEAARILGCHANTLRSWDANGTLKPTQRVGKTRYYSISMLEAFVSGGNITNGE